MADNNNDLSAVTVTAKRLKTPKPCQPVSNPLNDFASYTYSWVLWWVDVVDYNNLINQPDVDSALAFELSNNSYVLAQDAGLYPDRRHPATLGLNYNIQDVKFKTSFSPSGKGRSSNILEGEMTILEPYGISFVDTLVAASFDGASQSFRNWTQLPYMLELNFHGYDDQGMPIADSNMALYRKRFPIVMTEIKVDVTTKGAEYRVKFAPAGGLAHFPENGCVDKPITVIAGTVAEFFDENNKDSFTYQLNSFFRSKVALGKASVADYIKFDIDPSIASSKITYDKVSGLAQSNPGGIGIDLTKSSFTIPPNTAINDVITKVMAQSEYLISAQLGLEDSTAEKDLTKPFNFFKTTAQVVMAGTDVAGGIKSGKDAFDFMNNRFARSTTYKIHQYTMWSAAHPAVPLFADSTPYACKEYNYTYTGQNTDVIDLKVNFDTTYYIPVLSWTDQVASTLPTPDTSVEELLTGKFAVNLSPSLLARVYSTLGAVANPTPMRTKPIVSNPNITTGLNILSRPAAQVAADVIESIYTKADANMLTVQLGIIGDPTLIKQDDWLYVPSPLTSTNYNSGESLNQTQYVQRYGHFRTDAGEIPVLLNINSISDMDTELTNQGLAFPDPSSSVSTSLFSGQYGIIYVENRFSRGQFTQTLSLAKCLNSSYTTPYRNSLNGRGGSVSINQQNMLSTSSTNSGTSGVPYQR